LAAVAALLVVAALHPVAPSTSAARPNDGVALYERIRQQADAGHGRSRDALDRFEDFARARGLDPRDAAATAREISELVPQGRSEVRAVGMVPFFLRLDKQRPLRNSSELDAYVAERNAALLALASSDPARIIAVQVGFAARPSLPDAMALASSHGSVILELHVDLLLDGKRALSYGFRDDAAAALTSREPDDVIAEMLANIQSEDMLQCETEANVTSWSVRMVRLSLPAAAASRLAAEPGVVLVDPLTDAVDLYAARASVVNVAGWPTTTEAWERFHGTPFVDVSCEEAK
jgi:hypothetical protein